MSKTPKFGYPTPDEQPALFPAEIVDPTTRGLTLAELGATALHIAGTEYAQSDHDSDRDPTLDWVHDTSGEGADRKPTATTEVPEPKPPHHPAARKPINIGPASTYYAEGLFTHTPPIDVRAVYEANKPKLPSEPENQ